MEKSGKRERQNACRSVGSLPGTTIPPPSLFPFSLKTSVLPRIVVRTFAVMY